MRSVLASVTAPPSKRKALLWALVVWNPLVVAVVDATFGGVHGLGRRVFVGAVIANTVTVLCFGGSMLLQATAAAWSRRLGRIPRPVGLAKSFALAALLLPAALPVGLHAAALAAPLVGLERDVNVRGYRVGLGFGALFTTLFFLVHARSEARERAAQVEARARELENANLRSQLAALTAEMNPHLLFNALNTAAALVHVDPTRAEETLVELAELYRGTLRACGESMHPLAAELRLCEAYLRVEHARFADRLSTSVEVAEGLDADAVAVPVLSVQPLVENAVRHGVGPLARGGRVTVRAERVGDRLVVRVDDDGVGLDASPAPRDGAIRGGGNGRALANNRQRLTLAYGGRASLAIDPRPGGGTRATLSLPYGVA